MIAAGFDDPVGQRFVFGVDVGGSLRQVVLEPDNRIGPKRRRTDIGGIEKYVVRKDNIVGGRLNAVGEIEIIPKLDGVFRRIRGFVVVDGRVRDPVIEIE